MRRRGSVGRNPCASGWRVNWTAEFRRAAQVLGIWEDVRRELKDLEKRLRDPELREKTLAELNRNPIVGYYHFAGKRYSVRRYYFGKRTARGFYVVRSDICRVWFVMPTPRTNGTYRRKRWD